MDRHHALAGANAAPIIAGLAVVALSVVGLTMLNPYPLEPEIEEPEIDLQKITLNSHPKVLTNTTQLDDFESLSSHTLPAQ